MKDKRMCWPYRGFTLVELLVVIAIIGILVAMALPMLSGAGEKANQVKCMSHLKDFGVAVSKFQMIKGKGVKWPSKNFSGYRFSSTAGSSNCLRLAECLYYGSNPVLETTEILSCPSDSYGEDIPNDYVAGSAGFDLGGTAYLFSPFSKPQKLSGSSYMSPLAGDKIANHDEGGHLLFYDFKLEFFDKDSYPFSLSSSWEDHDSEVTFSNQAILQP
jgi:prepilin-type N-terminal cleavage/methylation domain-containing protein